MLKPSLPEPTRNHLAWMQFETFLNFVFQREILVSIKNIALSRRNVLLDAAAVL